VKVFKRTRISHAMKDRLLLYGLPVMMAGYLLAMGYYLIFVPDDPEHNWVDCLFGAGIWQLLRKLHQVMRGISIRRPHDAASGLQPCGRIHHPAR